VIDLGSLPPVAQGDGFVREPGEEATSCVAENETVCWGWAFDNADRWVTPTLDHLLLVALSVAFGFVIALAMGILSHRRRWLIPAFTGASGVLYTIPSIALFLLLLPISGRGNVTAVIALTLYTLQIIYRNIVTGLANVPEAARDSGRGMGMTERQVLTGIELPLAWPLIFAGIRTAAVYVVATAPLAAIAGGGGLGDIILNQPTYRLVGGIAATIVVVVLAFAVDALLAAAQRAVTPRGLSVPRELQTIVPSAEAVPAEAVVTADRV
jgi:osmoprotectant transport system permease protein